MAEEPEDTGGASIPFSEKGVQVGNARQAWEFANRCFHSGMLARHIQNGNQAFAIMCKGAELGLPPFASWDYIYPTKAGRLAIQTKGALGVVQSKSTYEDYAEHIEGEAEQMKAVVTAKRKGHRAVVKEFSYQDALVAGLLDERKNKRGEVYDSTYQSYLKDMLLSRARGRALDIAFAAELGGIPIEGVAEDIDMMESRKHGRTAPPAEGLPPAMERPALPANAAPDPFLEALRNRKTQPEPEPVEAEVVEKPAEKAVEAEPPPEEEESEPEWS